MVKKSPKPMKVYRKLNDDLITKLSCYVAEGNYYSTACHACGISERAFYEWMSQAETDLAKGFDESSSLPVRLMQAIKKAESEAELKLLKVVSTRAIERMEWLPAMTLLERRYPEKWGRKDRIQPGSTYNINMEQVYIEASNKLDQMLERLANRKDIPELEGEDWEADNLSNHEDK